MDIVYKGEVAVTYDKLRQRNKKWKKETTVIQKMVAGFEQGTDILDIPLGTGRFLPIYRNKGIHAIGLDISADMLKQAKNRMEGVERIPMIIGDAQHIPMASKSVDYVVCIRLLNWVTTAASKEIIREFCRVTRKGIVVGFRTQRDIRALEYIRSLLFDLIPTPHHLRRWKRLLVNFYKRATGKIKHEAAKRGFWKKQRKTRNKGIRNVYHDKNELFIHFSELNLEIVDRVYIDSTASYTKRKVRPYSIYRLEHKKRLGPVP